MVQFVSGAICASALAILTYYGRLVLDRTEIKSVSGVAGVADMAWLQKNWTTLAVPNPAMYYGRSSAAYVDESLVHRDRRYGRIDAITLGPGNFPLTTRWATTYDNFSVELLGIAQRYINQNVIDHASLESLLRAHSPHGTTFITSNVDPRTSQPFLLGNPLMMLGQLFYAIARQPSLKGVIYSCYTDYILHSGLIRLEPLADVLGELASPLKLCLSGMSSRSESAPVTSARFLRLSPLKSGPRLTTPRPSAKGPSTHTGGPSVWWRLSACSHSSQRWQSLSATN